MTPCNIEHSQHFYGGGTQRVMSDLFQQPVLIKKLSYMLSETIRTAQPVLIKWVSSLLGETIPTACAHKKRLSSLLSNTITTVSAHKEQNKLYSLNFLQQSVLRENRFAK